MCASLFRTHRRVTITMSHGGVTREPRTALTKVTKPPELEGIQYEDSEDSEDSDDEEASPEPRSGMKLEYYRHMPIDAIVRRHEEPPTSTRPTAREMYEEFKHLAVFNVSDMVKLKKAGMTGIAFDLYHETKKQTSVLDVRGVIQLHSANMHNIACDYFMRTVLTAWVPRNTHPREVQTYRSRPIIQLYRAGMDDQAEYLHKITKYLAYEYVVGDIVSLAEAGMTEQANEIHKKTLNMARHMSLNDVVASIVALSDSESGLKLQAKQLVTAIGGVAGVPLPYRPDPRARR